ncbi:MAG: HD domain-containing protein [Solirubrobacteraceae bacterium]
MSPSDAIAAVALAAPTRGNRKLEALIGAANADQRLRAWWHMQQVFATRLGMSDHSWVHVRIVLNIALRLFRLLVKRGVQPAMVRDHLMRDHDAEVVIAAGCLFHDTGMSIHRSDHEAFSLFLAAEHVPDLLEGIYDEPDRTVVTVESLHAVIGHRRRGDSLTPEAGIRARGRRTGPGPGPLAIDSVEIRAGEEKAVTIEIAMNNSSGIFQVDELLATKLHGSGLEEHVEVVALPIP